MTPFDALRVPLSGVALVEASAGTGKTHAITTLIVRLLLENRLSLDEILVVTFTEAATSELRGRVRRRLHAALAQLQGHGDDPEFAQLLSQPREGDRARISAALRRLDEAGIFTIHGFCQRVLQDAAFATGASFDAELSAEPQLICEELLADFWARELNVSGPVSPQERMRVELVREQRATARLRQLMMMMLRHPTARIVPEERDEGGVLELDQFTGAYEQLRATWRRDDIPELLKSPALKFYRVDHVRGWCDQMQAYLDAPPRRPATFKSFDKFRATNLAASCKRGREGDQPRDPFFDAADEVAEAVTRMEEQGRHEMIAIQQRLIDFVREQLPLRKRRARVLFFDDLLTQLAHAMERSDVARRVRQRYSVALIDEFQDTDPVQYAIFRRAWPTGTMLLIGDPKQAIYGFRGADVFAYLGAAARAERRYTMTTNWRSDPGLVSALGALFRLPRPFLMEIPYPEVCPRDGATDVFEGGDGVSSSPFELLFLPREGVKPIPRWRIGEQLPTLIASEVGTLLNSGSCISGKPVEAGDVAVLTRTNMQAFRVQQALRDIGVTSVVLGDQSVFEKERPEARELTQLLAAIIEPTRNSVVRAALISELMGVSALALSAMTDSREWEDWVERFRSWNRAWLGRGFMAMFRAFLGTAGVEPRLLSLSDGERRLTNLLHLAELLHRAETTLHLGPAGLLQWLQMQRSHAEAKVRPEETQIRLESDACAVKITTMHRSKGLEYPIVFCPYLWDGTLQHTNELVTSYHDDDLRIELDPAADHDDQVRFERFAENMRLAYVALTRAQHRCVVVWGALVGYETSALGYLLHPPTMTVDAPTVADIRSQLAGLDDERMYAQLCERQADGIATRQVDLGVQPPQVVAVAGGFSRLRVERLRRPVPNGWRTESFTGLSSDKQRLSEGRDHDQASPEVVQSDPSGTARIKLADFPRGARAGNFFHEVLEHLDFRDDAAIEPLVEARLAAYGYDPKLGEMASAAVREWLAVPLTRQSGLSLGALDRSDRLDELEFHLPVANAIGEAQFPGGAQLLLSFSEGNSAAALTADKLASVFADHPSRELAKGYAAQVRRLRFVPLAGFMKGYVDLVFRHDGRYYLADYKTNFLGETVGDYRREQVHQAMVHGHYYLQYHLYGLALHRFLERRVAGYRYDSHFGGVYYLFLRGMQRGARSGIFFERPPEARVAALSQLLDRPGGWT